VVRRAWLRDKHSFSGADRVWIARFAVSPATPQAAEVRLSRVLTDGTVVTGAWQDVAGVVVSVRDAVRAERRITVRLTAPGWQRDNIRVVRVDLRYGEGSQPASATLELHEDGAVEHWTHDFPDPSHPRYHWRARVAGVDGQRYATPWAQSAADDIDLTLPEPLW
jgi:hypothetical protein